MDDKFFLSMVDKFNASPITELEFSDGTTRLVLKKESLNDDGTSSETANRESKEEHTVRLGISANVKGEKIKSHIVATYYSSPSPDAPPFVKPGSKIKADRKSVV